MSKYTLPTENSDDFETQHTVPCWLQCCKRAGPLVAFLTLGVTIGGLMIPESVDPAMSPYDDKCDEYLDAKHADNRRAFEGLCFSHTRPNARLPSFDEDPEEPGEFHFLVVGDWGRDGWCCQRDVAVEMDYVASQRDVEFVVNTGDNFYPNGIVSTDDKQFETSWKNVYNQQHLGQLPWFSVLGNHDHRGNIEAQMQLSDKDERWGMPSRNYTRTFQDGLLQVVFLDTTPMIEKSTSEQVNDELITQQLAWANETLFHSAATWKVVVGHHPVHTVGEHILKHEVVDGKLIKPILEQNGVHAYFAGHDHNMQHLEEDHSNVQYIVSGAGSQVRTSEFSDPALKFFTSSQGFMLCTVSQEDFRIRFIDSTGHWLYNLEVGA